MADEPRPTTTAGPEAPQQFPTDASALSTVYTNFARVNVTPEELTQALLTIGLKT